MPRRIPTHRGRPLIITMLIAIGAVTGALLAPAAAHASVADSPPVNNGMWAGGEVGDYEDPYLVTTPSLTDMNTVQEMPNAHLFAAGIGFAAVTNPVTNVSVEWAEAKDLCAIFDSALQSDGKIIVVGNECVRRLIYDGTSLVEDTNFAPDFTIDSVRHVEVLPDDSIVLGGNFTSINSEEYAIAGLAKISADGVLDPAWTPGEAFIFDEVTALDSDPVTGDVYASGNYELASRSVRKFSSAGTEDTTFLTNVEQVSNFTDKAAYAIKVLSNQQLLIGRNRDSGAPQSSYRVNPNGTNDATYVGANVTNTQFYATQTQVLDFAEMSTGKYLITGGDSVQRVNADGKIDLTWTCGGSFSYLSQVGCQYSNSYPADTGDTSQAIELKNGKVLVAAGDKSFTLIAIGKPKVVDVSTGGRTIIRIDSYADVNGTTKGYGEGSSFFNGSKLMGFTLQYTNVAQQSAGKPRVIWARFIKPPTGLSSSITIDLTENRTVSACQTNLVVSGKPNPSCFRNSAIENNLSSPRIYTAFTMFAGDNPNNPFSIRSFGISANPITIAP